MENQFEFRRNQDSPGTRMGNQFEFGRNQDSPGTQAKNQSEFAPKPIFVGKAYLK